MILGICLPLISSLRLPIVISIVLLGVIAFWILKWMANERKNLIVQVLILLSNDLGLDACTPALTPEQLKMLDSDWEDEMWSNR